MAANQPQSMGIDMGTSAVRVALASQPDVTHVPCCVASPHGPYDPPPHGHELLFGMDACRRSIGNARHTAWALPRLLGQPLTSAAVQQEAERLCTHLGAGERGQTLLTFGGTTLWPEEALADLLVHAVRQHMNGSAQSVEQAVFVVPAQLSRTQRQALSHAARLAGLKVGHFVAGPVAALLGQWAAPREERPETGVEAVNGAEAADGDGTEQNPAEADATDEAQPETVLVVDAGAGTCDVALVRGTRKALTVLQLASVPLGGDHVDDALVQALASDFFAAHNMDLRQQPMAHERLRLGVQRARQLMHAEDSTSEQALNLPFIAADQDGAKHLSATLTPGMVLACTMPLIEQVADCCKQLLAQGQVSYDRLSWVLLCGGMQHHEGLEQALTALGAPVVRAPQEAAARGAAALAQAMTDKSSPLTMSEMAQQQAVPRGPNDKYGLTAHELQQLQQLRANREQEAARAQALSQLQQRAQTLLANLDAPSQAALEALPPDQLESDDNPLVRLRNAMASVSGLLQSPSDCSETALHSLSGRMQNLDVAVAQYQRMASHA